MPISLIIYELPGLNTLFSNCIVISKITIQLKKKKIQSYLNMYG